MSSRRVLPAALLGALAILSASATARAASDHVSDVDANGWCNIILMHGSGTGDTWGAPMLRQVSTKTTALWTSDGSYKIQWDNSLRLFLYLSGPGSIAYYGVPQSAGDVEWRTGGIPGSDLSATGVLPVPTTQCASRFREEDGVHCANVLVYHAASTQANRLYSQRTESPNDPHYNAVASPGMRGFTLTFTPHGAIIESHGSVFYHSRRLEYPISSMTLERGRFGHGPVPLMSCVGLAPIPTPPPLGGAGTRPLVPGRSSAGVAIPGEFVYFTYDPPAGVSGAFQVRVSPMGAGSDDFWFVALGDGELPTHDGFSWSGETCVAAKHEEFLDPTAPVFIGVFKFNGRPTPFTIQAVEDPDDAECR